VRSSLSIVPVLRNLTRIPGAPGLMALVLASAACGGARTADTVTPTTPTATVPGAPTNLVATSGNGLAILQFTAPASTGGSPITGYTATCTASGGSKSGAGASSPITVQGLSNGVSYSCTVAASNAVGTGSLSGATTVTPVATVALGSFSGNIVLGVPTGNSVTANVYAPTQSGSVYIAYGTTAGVYDRQTSAVPITAGTPLEIPLTGLATDTRYYYRLYYVTSGAGSGPTDEYSFHTARPAGATFTFAAQGDSHPERTNTEFDATLYTRTLTAAANDHPDFFFTSGDDFSVDTQDPLTITEPIVANRYLIQRPYLGIIGRSAPVFLVNGNHEQAARYLLNGTPNSVAVWAQNARNRLYSQPAPGAFYSGNSDVVPDIGLLRNYYAFTWGDALFVTIDPYWGSPVCVDNPFYGGAKRSNLWDITHGDAQYQWLKRTLEQSPAKYKFVFAHHVMGTQRGGIDVARLYEWGGQSPNGNYDFTAQRPTWAMPIHQLLAANHVTIFFQGHDHIWVHQQLDGVTYQTLPEPADPNYSLFNADAYATGDKFPNAGYARVTVGPAGVKVEYVRSWLPQDELPGKTTGTVAFSYTIP